MNSFTYIKRSLLNTPFVSLAVLLAVAVGTAILTGALLVGDSMKASLKAITRERLGTVTHVFQAPGVFSEQLAKEGIGQNRLNQTEPSPALLVNALAIHNKKGVPYRSNQVRLRGIDETFLGFIPKGGEKIFGKIPKEGSVYLNQKCADKLQVAVGDEIVIRLKKINPIPEESSFGNRKLQSVGFRATVAKILPNQGLGRFSLSASQLVPENIFVSLKSLQETLELEGKINTVLFSTTQEAKNLKASIKKSLSLADLGLKIRLNKKHKYLSLESDSLYLSSVVGKKALETAQELGLRPRRILTYLANEIRFGQEKPVPFSTVSAIEVFDDDDQALQALKKDERALLLVDWVLKNRKIKKEAELSLSYYTTETSAAYQETTKLFRFAGSLPLKSNILEPGLAPYFPGISDANAIDDWKSPVPVDLKKIKPEDESYWDDYKTTPKALISLEAGQKLWGSRFGKLTAIHFELKKAKNLETLKTELEKKLLSKLEPAKFGLVLRSVLKEGMLSSNTPTDFGMLFVSLSFFLLLSAGFLIALLYRLGMDKRSAEVGLLLSIGLTPKKVRHLFLFEGFLISLLGSGLGVIAGTAYGWAMMTGLKTIWRGAVGTSQLVLSISPLSLCIGFIAGIILSLCSITWAVRMLKKQSARHLLSGGALQGIQQGQSKKVFKWLPFFFFVPAGAFLVLALLKQDMAVIGFFGAGALMLAGTLSFIHQYLKSQEQSSVVFAGKTGAFKIGWRNLKRYPSRSMLSVGIVASAMFLVTATGVSSIGAHDDIQNKKGSAGGFTYLAESTVPLFKNLSNKKDLDDIGFTKAEQGLLKNVKFSPFRLRKGSEASCLNLSLPAKMTTFGLSTDFIKENRFAFKSASKETKNPWKLLEGKTDKGIPAVLDSETAQWILKVGIGDTFKMPDENGKTISFEIVGILKASMLQGYLLISEENFKACFPSESGRRAFFVELESGKAKKTADLLRTKLERYGLSLTASKKRLADLHEVVNAYLSAFSLLGGLGLVLGTLGLGTVLLRSVLERQKETALMRVFGFSFKRIALMVMAENFGLIFFGVLAGILSALLALLPGIQENFSHINWIPLGVDLGLVFLLGFMSLFIALKVVANVEIKEALKKE